MKTLNSNQIQLISLGFEIQKYERLLKNKNLGEGQRKLYQLILTGKKNLYLKKREQCQK